MAGIMDDIKYRFNNAPILKQLIYINVGVYVLVQLVNVVLLLFNRNGMLWLPYLEVSTHLPTFICRPWTAFTYMFIHHDIWHILFNVLWLYWFGTIFIQYFSQKHLSTLYIMGGLAGAAMYLLAYNTFPYFADKEGLMCGASAAIMAIVFATTLRVPDFQVNLLLIGRVSLKYIAAFTIIIDLLSMTSPNAGGHFAHIGGALMGIAFGWYWNSGKDILRPVIKLIDNIMGGWKHPHIKIKKTKPGATRPKNGNTRTQSRPETDGEYLARKKREADEIDRLLDKIKKSGYSALTTEEKQRLFDAGKKH